MIDSFRGEYDWASNFYYKAPFRVNDIDYRTSEHFFMACKTLDPQWVDRIVNAFKAKDAKALGRQVPIRPDWNQVRMGVMAQALWHKFTQNDDIRQKLIETAPSELVEGNYWHDNTWGDCRCENKSGRHPECLDQGDNALGRLLMAHRATFITVATLSECK